jgi:hypothetical protein
MRHTLNERGGREKRVSQLVNDPWAQARADDDIQDDGQSA